MPCANQMPPSDMIPAPAANQILRVTAAHAHLGAGVGSPQAAGILTTAASAELEANQTFVFSPTLGTTAANLTAALDATNLSAQVMTDLADASAANASAAVPADAATGVPVTAVAAGLPQIVATQDAGALPWEPAPAPAVVHEEAVFAEASATAPTPDDSPNVLPLGSVVAQLPGLSMPAGRPVPLIPSAEGARSGPALGQ